MLITDEEIALNKRGILSPLQLKKVRRKGVVQLVAATVFLALVVASLLMTRFKWGPVLIIWIATGLLLAFVLLWSARSYLAIRSEGSSILSITGKVNLRSSGSKHVLVTVNERSFLLMKNEAATLRKDEVFTLNYIEDPMVLVGWYPSGINAE